MKKCPKQTGVSKDGSKLMKKLDFASKLVQIAQTVELLRKNMAKPCLNLLQQSQKEPIWINVHEHS